MSMNARRQKKAAQAATTAPTAAPTAATPKKKAGVSGPMRSIAIGRSYRTYSAPIDEDGRPVHRSVFDPQGHASAAIDSTVDKERVVNNSDFFAHINETVFKQVFGVPLRGKLARMIIEGISDQCLVLAEQGYKVKMPNLVTLTRVERAARKARNPKTNEEVQVPARPALAAKATRSAKAYMAQAGA